MDRRTFGMLCELPRHNRKIKFDVFITLEEQVRIFLRILSHNVKII